MALAKKHDRSIGALGARWGMQSEKAFRNALAGILEQNFGVQVLNVNEYVEHKSYVESWINLDLLRYRVRIWEQWLNAGNAGPLPVIVPVVFYHGAAGWSVSRQFADGVADAPALLDYVPHCVYHPLCVRIVVASQ